MKGLIYKLVGGGKDYYGSTTRCLPSRYAEHKWGAKNGKQGGAYSYFNEIGWDNVRIELVEEVSVETIRDLHEIENRYISENECLNRQRAFLSEEERKRRDEKHNQKKKERYLLNRDNEIEKRRQWYLENREVIKQKARERYRSKNPISLTE